jgi:hypothetical protein
MGAPRQVAAPALLWRRQAALRQAEALARRPQAVE